VSLPDNGKEKGRLNERRVIDAIEIVRCRDPWFWWIWSVRPATEQEDHRGIDAMLQSEIGAIIVQVKSRGRGAQEYRQRARRCGADPRDIAIVVAPDDDEALLRAVKGALVSVYEHRVGEQPERLDSLGSRGEGT
jgi:hypothetical protein